MGETQEEKSGVFFVIRRNLGCGNGIQGNGKEEDDEERGCSEVKARACIADRLQTLSLSAQIERHPILFIFFSFSFFFFSLVTVSEFLMGVVARIKEKERVRLHGLLALPDCMSLCFIG